MFIFNTEHFFCGNPGDSGNTINIHLVKQHIVDHLLTLICTAFCSAFLHIILF